jgi:hypothetical protein
MSIEDGKTCLVDGSAKMSDGLHLISVADLESWTTRCVLQITKVVMSLLQNATTCSCLFCSVRPIIFSHLRIPGYVTDLTVWSSVPRCGLPVKIDQVPTGIPHRLLITYSQFQPVHQIAYTSPTTSSNQYTTSPTHHLKAVTTSTPTPPTHHLKAVPTSTPTTPPTHHLQPVPTSTPHRPHIT